MAVAATLREIEARFLAVMPVESTIDRSLHARAVARVVFEAKRHATWRTRQKVALTSEQVAATGALVRRIRDRMWSQRAPGRRSGKHYAST
jgi:hypothetical protein